MSVVTSCAGTYFVSCCQRFCCLRSRWVGACNSAIFSLTDLFLDRISLDMRLPWECHNQSQETNWHHWVTRPELPFFHKRKDILKIDQSAKRPWHRLIIGVACSYSLAPGSLQYRRLVAESDDLLLCSICSSSLSCRRVGWMLGGNGVGWRNSFCG